jgi:proteic killer suppression protein
MIASFGDKATEDLYHGLQSARVRKIPVQIWRAACRKLDMIDYADELDDLRIPPGNRLEALKGNLVGYHSIRGNDQWRIVFQWQNGVAREVAVIDYHSG